MQLKASVILVPVVHTRLSPGFNHKVWSIITQALLRVVQFSVLRVVQTDLQDTIWMMFVLKINSKLCSAENNARKSEEASELGPHWAALLFVKSKKYISMTQSRCDSLFSLASSYGELLIQLVNTRSHLNTNTMNVRT